MIFIGGFIIGFIVGLIFHIFMVMTHDTIELTPTILWYPYPENKPVTSEHILVTLKNSKNNNDNEVCEIDYGVAKIEAEEGNIYWKNILNHIVAWCFMPEPYKGKTDKW